MGKIVKFLGLLLCTIVTLSACTDGKTSEVAKDSTLQAKLVKEVVVQIENPRYTDSEAFINDVIEQREFRRCESILSRLSLSEINEMCKVIIHREGFVDWKSFLKEYDTSYQRVYRYLEEPDKPNINNDTDTIYKTKNKNIEVNVTKNGTTRISDPVHRK